MLRKIPYYKLLLFVLLLLLLSAGWGEDSEEEVDAIIGIWELSALTGTYIRDVAQPTDSDPTSYVLTASWNYAAAVMGNDSAKADQTISAFSVGDTVLNKTSALPSAAYLTAAGVAMTGTFNDQDVYTLTGTYPTLRLDEDACNTYQTVAQITDQGYYGVVYNDANTGGTFTIAPNASLGDQVLPPFDDATVTFTNDGNTLNIQFEDRDSHDVDYAEVMTEWSETDDRVIMGIAQVPIDPTTGAFTAEESDSLNSSGYLMSAALTYWSGYATFYYLTIAGEAEFLAVTQAITDDGDGNLLPEALYHMTVNNATGSTHSGLPYAALVSAAGVPTNDSAGNFDPTSPATMAAGGKLTYNVNALCISVNEIILFDLTFEKKENGIYGCTEPDATNYNPDATIDDGSCDYDCIDSNVILTLQNLNTVNSTFAISMVSDTPIAGFEIELTNISITGIEYGGDETHILIFSSENTISFTITGTGVDSVILEVSYTNLTGDICIINPVCRDQSNNNLTVCVEDCIQPGCTELEACNYDPDSTNDDGSCLYNDCAGECGGSAVVDECGECGGNGWDGCDDDGNGINNKEQYGYGAYDLSVSDIPNDQGGYVYLSFTKSFYDTDILSTEINDDSDWANEGVEFYTNQRKDDELWISLQPIAAYGSELYTTEVRTLSDSTSIDNALTEFRVIAAMIEGNFVSIETVTGYSVDNIAPATLTSLLGVYDESENKAVLSWAPSDANDISHYKIYRNAALHSTTTETSFTDEITEDTEYAVSAVDIHENESDMSASILVSMPLNIIDNLIPTKYELMTAYPNPFNPITSITYGLPEYTNVQIIIFDLSGKRVTSLINEFQSPGYHSINWNADNHPSGMYFITMIAGDYVNTQKLMLVK